MEVLSPSANSMESKPSTSGHSPENSHAKRKHHRRAKKGRKRHLSPSSPEKEESKPKVTSPTPCTSGSLRRTQFVPLPPSSYKSKKHHGKKQVYLRPTNGPLLNAPRNSTQFIIDDHENSNHFYDFNNVGGGNGGGLASRDASNSAWDEFIERDFQSVYETAHQEEVAEWDRKKLCDEIASLERRQKELVNILARLDPEIYLQRLQSELLELQEANRSLKEERASLQPDLPDSSTSEAVGASAEASAEVDNEDSSQAEASAQVNDDVQEEEERADEDRNAAQADDVEDNSEENANEDSAVQDNAEELLPEGGRDCQNVEDGND